MYSWYEMIKVIVVVRLLCIEAAPIPTVEGTGRLCEVMMIHARWFTLFLLGIGVATLGKAETIHLKNGDQLNGSFQQMTSDTVTFKADIVGVVTIPASNIVSFKSENPVLVVLKNQQSETGVLLLQQGQWQVISGTQTIPLKEADILAIYAGKQYNAAEIKGPAKPWLGWKGTGNVGYSLQDSTQRSTSFVAGIAASRDVPDLPGLPLRRQTVFGFSAAFLSVTAPPATTTSNNTLSASLLENLFFDGNQSNFVFLEAELDHIQPLQLYLRQTYGGGIGRDIIRNPRTVFSVRGGLTYVRSRFNVPPITNGMEALASEKLTLTLLKHLSLNHEFDFYPSLTSGGDYRFDTATTLNSPISHRLSFQLGFIDHYLSAPPLIVGVKKNDVILSAGLGFTF